MVSKYYAGVISKQNRGKVLFMMLDYLNIIRTTEDPDEPNGTQ
jgi:hypothetical protein